jgi:hypothetical protein
LEINLPYLLRTRRDPSVNRSRISDQAAAPGSREAGLERRMRDDDGA